MKKLGFTLAEIYEMDLDLVYAFEQLQIEDEKRFWETWINIFKKIFGDK